MSRLTRAADSFSKKTDPLDPTDAYRTPLVNTWPRSSVILSSHSGYLLDTHTFLWAVADPKRLGSEATKALENSASQLYLSSVSAFELTNKQRLGKLDAKFEKISANYTAIARHLGTQDLSLRLGHCYLAGSMDWPHRDLFDRFLVAQAALENLTIITNDAQISAHPWVETIW